MKFPEPSKLRTAVVRLRRDHPDRLADFRDPAKLAHSNIGQRIKRKVLEWKTPPNFGPLLESMNSIELELLPTYLSDKNGNLRVRIAQCIGSKPRIANAEKLLPVLHRNQDTDQLPYLLTAMSVAADHYELPPAAATFVRDWRYDDLDAAIRNAWRQTESTEPRAVVEETGFDPDTNLGRAIQQGFLTHAPVGKWIRAGADAFLEAFEAAERPRKLETLVRLWTGWRIDSIKSLMNQPFARRIGEYLTDHPRFVDLLERNNREAYEFFRNWLKSLELDTFFAAFPDNDRFAFWESYLPRITAVRGDREFGRLFLDFGNFGVIEFADIGHAAYAYEPTHFEHYQTLNFKVRHADNNRLKNQTQAILRLTHGGNWQASFREKLRDYLQGRNEILRPVQKSRSTELRNP